MAEDLRIDWIGLSQLAHSTCKVSDLTRIDDSHRQLSFAQPKSQFVLITACCFQHDPLWGKLFQSAGQYLDASLAILFRPRLISGSNGYVKTLLGNVNTNPYLMHGEPRVCDVYLILGLAGYGLDSAQAFIRVLGNRCGDQKLRTVFSDLRADGRPQIQNTSIRRECADRREAIR